MFSVFTSRSTSSLASVFICGFYLLFHQHRQEAAVSHAVPSPPVVLEHS